jgi:dihydroorotate dehydrogenase electron transfer subunit
MKKAQVDFKVIENNKLSNNYSHLVLMPVCLANVSGDTVYNGSETVANDSNEVAGVKALLAGIGPGQFVQVLVEGDAKTFLRRPISVHYVDVEKGLLHLLIRNAGSGTKTLINSAIGDVINIILPLGNGFGIDGATLGKAVKHPLLIGGGVGTAPLRYLGKVLRDNGVEPTFLLAAKTGSELLMVEEFKQLGRVIISTDDGSVGHHGLITMNPALRDEAWDMFYCCGPMPMMKGIAKIATELNVACEVSLENSMACGLGACLCCVEDTVDGHVCVCTEGPVFDIKRLKW